MAIGSTEETSRLVNESPQVAGGEWRSPPARGAPTARRPLDAYIFSRVVVLSRGGKRTVATDRPADEGRAALQVACDTDVSGCVFLSVFLMRTEADDRGRLGAIARDHVREQRGKGYTLDEIDERRVNEVEV